MGFQYFRLWSFRISRFPASELPAFNISGFGAAPERQWGVGGDLIGTTTPYLQDWYVVCETRSHALFKVAAATFRRPWTWVPQFRDQDFVVWGGPPELCHSNLQEDA